MENIVLISIAVIIVVGIFSQWLAWRIQWPSIVIMSIAGLLLGPVFGLFNPQEALGSLYSPLISLSVAIILFEGSSSLDIREIKGVSKSVSANPMHQNSDIITPLRLPARAISSRI
ncbi:hypothetical protein GCM10007971_30570 [Oceanobacillus indicireducens]|uniref:Cation/H+ exchanger domain-containing protein n=1 Tax=Oceanobacillus indicireducens TaxID=1004261 RepID=A0A918D489_9BACI|nr:hypothetical protein GCM10007971_30570 [Oceanobacillus indicireducens]